MTSRKRTAFNLIELLAVVSIFSLLLSVLIPAVSSTREAARRMTCQNNLKQIGAATLNYESAHRAFPPGYLGPQPRRDLVEEDWNSDQHIGVLAQILPYIEETATHSMISRRMGVRSVDQNWTANYRDTEKENADPTIQAASVLVPSYVCPSTNANANEFATITALNIYSVERYYANKLEITVWCEQYAADRPNPCEGPERHGIHSLGRSNYLGSAGGWGHTNDHWRKFAGVFGNRSQVRYAQVLDGTTKTILFGEATGGWTYVAGKQRRDLSYSWIGVGVMPLAYGLVPNQPSDRGFIANRNPGWYQFSSEHAQGAVNFCFADGSVHTLNTDVDYDIYLSLGGYRDGNSVEANDF